MINIDYWKSLGVPAEEIKSNIKNERGRYKTILLEYSKDTRSIIADFLNFSIDASKTDTQNVEAMLLSSKFPEYICVERFLSGKVFFLEDFYKTPKFSPIISKVTSNEPIIKMIKLFENNKNNLITLLIFCEFYQKGSSKRYFIDKDWTPSTSAKFKESFRGLKNRVSRKFKRKFGLIGEFNDGESEYYAFHRAKRAKIQEGFGLNNVSYIPKSDLFIKIELKEKVIEIRCSDRNLVRLLLKFLKDKLDLKLVSADTVEEDYNKIKAQIKQVLFTEPGGSSRVTFHIDDITFHEAGDVPKVQLNLGRKNSQIDVRPSVIKLDQQDFVDVDNLENLKSFSINIRGRSHLIEVEKTGNSVFFKYEGSDKNQFETLAKEIGLGVNVTTFPTPTPEQLKQDFQKLLNYNGRPRLREYEKKLLEEMKQKALVELTSESLWRCRDKGHIRPNEYERCPQCGGKMQKISDYSGSKINLDGVRIYIKQLLITKFGAENVSESERTMYSKTYKLYHVKIEGFDFYVHIDDGLDISKVCKQFQRSLMPFIVVTNLQRTKGYINEELFPIIQLQDLYFDQSNNLIKTEAQRLETTFFSRLETAARASSREITNLVNGASASYTRENLEDDTFNLMKYVFKTGEKWGKTSSGLPVPDAALGYSTIYKTEINAYKKGRVSLIWDCKYHGGNSTYDLESTEKEKARSYVQRANNSSAIKNFSKQLNSYVTFCNSVNLTQYKNFAEVIYGYQRWKGSVVLIDLKALLKFYKFATESDYNEKRISFLAEFSKAIERPRDNNFVHITEAKAGEIISTARTAIIPTLVTSELRQFLELNIITT